MSGEFEHINEKYIVQSRHRMMDKNHFVRSRHSAINRISCSVCGAQTHRLKAKFCAVCGHELCRDYAPLDLLKASYNLRKQTKSRINSPPEQKELQKLFLEDSNSAASTAMAFVVYSLVPYLGILFCPGALILGGIGLAVSFRKPQLGGRQTAAFSLLLGSIILASQTLLWWLLYIVPELKR